MIYRYFHSESAALDVFAPSVKAMVPVTCSDIVKSNDGANLSLTKCNVVERLIIYANEVYHVMVLRRMVGYI